MKIFVNYKRKYETIGIGNYILHFVKRRKTCATLGDGLDRRTKPRGSWGHGPPGHRPSGCCSRTRWQDTRCVCVYVCVLAFLHTNQPIFSSTPTVKSFFRNKKKGSFQSFSNLVLDRIFICTTFLSWKLIHVQCTYTFI